MKTFLKFLFTAVVISFLTTGAHAAKKITIVYTNSLNGYFDDCRCKEHPKGGLVARGTELQNIRKQYKNIFFFETGDFFSVDSDKLLEKYLVKGYKYLKYDAITFGDQELSSGVESFLKYSSDLPLVNNNIRLKIDGKWKEEFERYKIITKGGIKAGVIGSMSPEAFKYYPKAVTDNVVVWDQVAEIKKDIQALKAKKVDVIILLSHSGFDRDKELAKALPELDVIVGGHTQTLINPPAKIGNTVIVQAGTNGANIGILELSVNKNNKVIKNSFRLPHLKITPADPGIQKMIDEYKKEVKENTKGLRFD